MKNIPLLIAIGVIVIGVVGYFLFIQPVQTEHAVLSSTYSISKEYLALRLRTDSLLVNAKNYESYDTWNRDMDTVIADWNTLESDSQKLSTSADNTAKKLASHFSFIRTAHAYSAKEISNIYDKAPRFQGIATLAKHLGVDAKRAQAILNQAQAEITSDVFTEEGNAFEKLENTAIVVKDGCKVAGFVGGVVLTGGAAGLATAGTLTQVTVVVTGVDLALEVTEDSAQIAFGDKNKVSSFVKDVRTVTEPIASVMAITNVPSNLGNAFGKFDSVMVGLEQFRDAVQEGKVVGVDLTNFAYQKPFQRIRQATYPGTVTVAELEKAEVEEWLKSLNSGYKPTTQQEAEEFVKVFLQKPIAKTEQTKAGSEKESTSDNVTTGWKGTLVNVSGGNNKKHETELDFTLNSDGTVSGGNFKKWKQEGDTITVFGEDEEAGYYQFTVSQNSLTLSRIKIGNEEIEPGQEYMGGIAPMGVLYKKSESKKSEESKKGSISFKEWDGWGDADSRYKDDLIEKFGSPSSTQTKSGKEMWVYTDLVLYESGRTCSPLYTFYETDQVATRRCESAENVKVYLNR